MYTGTLINDLLDTVERVCNSAVDSLAATGPETKGWRTGGSKPEQFSQSLGLGSADRDLGLLFVVHPQLVRTLEPGHDFADTVDIHEVGSVGSPK